LLNGLDWFSFLEIESNAFAVDKIGCERRVVERVEPLPGNTAKVIIRVDPLEALYV